MLVLSHTQSSVSEAGIFVQSFMSLYHIFYLVSRVVHIDHTKILRVTIASTIIVCTIFVVSLISSACVFFLLFLLYFVFCVAFFFVLLFAIVFINNLASMR